MKVGDLVINEYELIGIVLKVDEEAGLYRVWTCDPDDLWDCEVQAKGWMVRFTPLEVIDESR